MFTFPVGNFSQTVAGGNTHSLNLQSSSSQLAYISHASQTNLGLTAANTVEGYIKFQSLPGISSYYSLFSKYSSAAVASANDYMFSIRNSGFGYALVLDFVTYDGVSTYTHLSHTVLWGAPSVGTWYHVAAIFGGTGYVWTTIFVLDGAQLGLSQVTATSDTFNSTGNRSVALGAEGAGNYFDGKMDNWRFWSTQLSPSTINTNKNVELSSGANLELSLLLNNNYNDATANANNFTGVNSPTFSTDTPF